MSHFTALVIGADVEGQLAPYHEFECTGTDDQYIQSIDQMDEARADFQKHADSGQSFADFIEGWYGRERLGASDQPDLKGRHKYGWLRVDASGNVLECIDRTNPNAKWDYWVIGGRRQGFLLLNQRGISGMRAYEELGRGHFKEVNQAFAAQIDWEGMQARARKRAEASYQEWLTRDRGRIDAAWLYDIEFLPEIHAAWVACQTEDERTAWRAARSTADMETVEQYAHRQACNAGVTHAVVKDGIWSERGQGGWFGSIHDAMPPEEWARRYWEMIEKLPADTLLTIVDYHI